MVCIVPDGGKLFRSHHLGFRRTYDIGQQGNAQIPVGNEVDAAGALRHGTFDLAGVRCRIAGCDRGITDTEVQTIGIEANHLHCVHFVLGAAHLALCRGRRSGNYCGDVDRHVASARLIHGIVNPYGIGAGQEPQSQSAYE